MGKLTNLNPPATIADADIPGSITRDAEVTAALTAHIQGADPHTGKRTFSPGAKSVGLSTGTIAENNNSVVNRCGLEAQASGATDAAYMSFHRPGLFAIHFGLDSNTNRLSVGGWSMGPISYDIFHRGFGEPVWQSPSDSRLKQNIRPIPSALALLLECKPVSFRYNRTIREKKDFFGSSFQRDKVHYGFLADDVPLQDLVFEKDGHLGLDYLEFIPFIVRAMQEQQEQIKLLEARLETISKA